MYFLNNTPNLSEIEHILAETRKSAHKHTGRYRFLELYDLVLEYILQKKVFSFKFQPTAGCCGCHFLSLWLWYLGLICKITCREPVKTEVLRSLE